MIAVYNPLDGQNFSSLEPQLSSALLAAVQERRQALLLEELQRLGGRSGLDYVLGLPPAALPTGLGNPASAFAGAAASSSSFAGLQSIDDIIERALRYIDLAVSMGIGAIRTHVDTCDDEPFGDAGTADKTGATAQCRNPVTAK